MRVWVQRGMEGEGEVMGSFKSQFDFLFCHVASQMALLYLTL